MSWKTRLLVGLALVATAGCCVLGGSAWAEAQFQRLSVRVPGSADDVWLVVGVDDRRAASAEIAEDVGGGAPGARADIVLLARRAGDEFQILSLDRRLLLTQGATAGRLGSSWLDGPQATVDLLCDGLGVGVDHVVRTDFASLVGLVDALGGVEVELETALRDEPAHLAIEAGRQEVNGRVALGLVRSRQGEVLVDGSWRPEKEGALGRQQRAGQVIRGIASRIGAADWPTRWRAFRATAPTMALDEGTSLWELARLAGADPVVTALHVQAAPDDELFAQLGEGAAEQLAPFRASGCSRER